MHVHVTQALSPGANICRLRGPIFPHAKSPTGSCNCTATPPVATALQRHPLQRTVHRQLTWWSHALECMYLDHMRQTPACLIHVVQIRASLRGERRSVRSIPGACQDGRRRKSPPRSHGPDGGRGREGEREGGREGEEGRREEGVTGEEGREAAGSQEEKVSGSPRARLSPVPSSALPALLQAVSCRMPLCARLCAQW